MALPPRRVGIVGFGHIGQYLVDAILKNSDFELAFAWNRTPSAFDDKLDKKYILSDLSKFAERPCDLIVEVAHPSIAQQYGVEFLQHADFMVGSPVALADQEFETRIRRAAVNHALYIPSGAFWGGEDIKKMADRGSLTKLKVTMKKHPKSFRLSGDLQVKNDQVQNSPVVLYEGPVRILCPLAPHNVNTMATAAITAHGLGFDGVEGCLIADPDIPNWHIIEIEATGLGSVDNAFSVHTVRKSPVSLGAVTSAGTFTSFLSSMIEAKGKSHGVHLC